MPSSRTRRDAVPALAALARVAPILARRGHRWGPGGSVGFELATGVPTATASSDLDVILRQDRRLEPTRSVRSASRFGRSGSPSADRRDARDAARRRAHSPDLAARPAQVLVRTPDGARLAADPWMCGRGCIVVGGVMTVALLFPGQGAQSEGPAASSAATY